MTPEEKYLYKAIKQMTRDGNIGWHASWDTYSTTMEYDSCTYHIEFEWDKGIIIDTDHELTVRSNSVTPLAFDVILFRLPWCAAKWLKLLITIANMKENHKSYQKEEAALKERNTSNIKNIFMKEKSNDE